MATPKDKTTTVATTSSAGPPTALLDELAKYADAGVSKRAEDNIVPLVNILQRLSPQVDPRNPKYIEGAEPADIWLRNAPHPIVKGNEGIVFQPCYFGIVFLEWVPRERGGGLVARYAELPSDAIKDTDPQNRNKVKFLRPNGNEVIQTRQHVGFVLQDGAPPLPFVIPFQGAGHKVSREWMFKIRSRPSMPDGRGYPSFATLYRLRTRPQSNALGTWYAFDITEEGWIQTLAEKDRGAALLKQFESEELVAEAPEAAVIEDDATTPM